MAYAKLIVNPASCSGRTARKWPELMVRLKDAGLKFDHELTEAPGHATIIAREARAKGYGLIISVGGDGTINEIVNGLCDGGVEKDVLLGIISMGTGSDYIRTLGLPRSPTEAAHRLLNPEKIAVDIGMVEFTKDGKPANRLFINFAGVGIDAEITRAANQKYKRLGARPGYFAGLFDTLVTYRNEETELKIDGKSAKKKLSEVLVSSGKYGGGSMMVAPSADPSDGLLDVMTLDAIGRLELIRCFPMVYKGTHTHHPKIFMTRAKEIEVAPLHPWPLQADGEMLGETPIKIKIIPGAIKIAV